MRSFLTLLALPVALVAFLMARAGSGVHAWWIALSAVAVLNLVAWAVSAALVLRRKTEDPQGHEFRRRQIILSALYVAGCAFRSFLPRVDGERYVLHDTWLSSVAIGRTVATVAELCFAAQLALLLHAAATEAKSSFGRAVAKAIVPMIAVAEAFSWYGTITTNAGGNAIEESLWALMAALVVTAILFLWRRAARIHRHFLIAAACVGAAYVAFMITVDVPMYVGRWLEDEAAGVSYLGLFDGLRDTWSWRIVTSDWAVWRPEMPWMSLYFSVAVWCSIALAHVPTLRVADEARA